MSLSGPRSPGQQTTMEWLAIPAADSGLISGHHRADEVGQSPQMTQRQEAAFRELGQAEAGTGEW